MFHGLFHAENTFLPLAVSADVRPGAIALIHLSEFRMQHPSPSSLSFFTLTRLISFLDLKIAFE